jgi:UMF1 family MFS transporter
MIPYTFRMNKKKLFLWCLYDFANSIVWSNFLLYFTRWIVVDGGMPDLHFNLIFIISATTLLFISPPLAARTDRRGGLVRNLSLATWGMTLFLGAAALFPLFSWNVYGAGLMFLLGIMFYQLSFVFYNPLLNDLADESHRCRASGWGQFANATGMIFGLVLFAPLQRTGIGALFPSVLAFFLLALPIMLFYKEDKKIVRSAKDAFEKINIKKLIKLFSVPGVAAALLSYNFFNDASKTMSTNLSIYTKQVFDATENMTILMVVLVLTMTALGGVIGGMLGDRIGHRRALFISLGAYGLLFPMFALADNFATAMIVTTIMGFFLGTFYAASHAYASTVIPKKDLALGFSFYSIFERFSVTGPLTWGLVVTGTGSYRLAMAAMTFFVLLGALSMFIRTKTARKIRAG